MGGCNSGLPLRRRGLLLCWVRVVMGVGGAVACQYENKQILLVFVLAGDDADHCTLSS